jgi:hypothetical protein
MFASAGVAVAATLSGGGPVQASVTSVTSGTSLQIIRIEQARAEQTAAAAKQKRAAADAAAAVAAAKKRAAAARSKAAALAAFAKKKQAAQLASGDPRQVAQAMLGQFGWSSSQFSCLNWLWIRESNWQVHALNPSSGAYGIPQSLPASKMGSAGSDWQTSAYTQIKWGLAYIRDVYGSPCGAWSHETAYNWY